MANLSLCASIGLMLCVISVSFQQQLDSAAYWRFNKKIARQYQAMSNPSPNPNPNQNGVNLPESLITGISFDCTGKQTGPNKDPQYCDVFHACVYGKQQKTYACPQIGDRFYFDQATQR